MEQKWQSHIYVVPLLHSPNLCLSLALSATMDSAYMMQSDGTSYQLYLFPYQVWKPYEIKEDNEAIGAIFVF